MKTKSNKKDCNRKTKKNRGGSRTPTPVNIHQSIENEIIEIQTRLANGWLWNQGTGGWMRIHGNGQHQAINIQTPLMVAIHQQNNDMINYMLNNPNYNSTATDTEGNTTETLLNDYYSNSSRQSAERHDSFSPINVIEPSHSFQRLLPRRRPRRRSRTNNQQ